MKEELVLLAAKAGFRQHIDNYYHWLCDLQKWLTEEHKIHINVFMGDGDGYKCVVQWYTPTYNGFETYEQALEAGLKKALEKL